MSVIVTAEIRAKQGCGIELEQHIKAVIKSCQGQRGMQIYIAYKNPKDDHEFIFYEIYDDLSCFEEHANSHEIKVYRANSAHLLESRNIKFWEEIA